MSAAPTLNALLNFAATVQGQSLKTAGGRAEFRVDVTSDGVCYTPMSTGRARKQTRERLGQIIERHGESGSLRPSDYTDLTRHSSYALGLISAYLLVQQTR